MEYNTQQRKLPLPEYGRNVQNMVDLALTIEDREERQRCANTIVNIMGGMFPQFRIDCLWSGRTYLLELITGN